MADEHVPGYVDAPVRARIAQAALFFHVTTRGAMYALAPVVLALYGPQGYRQDSDLDPVSHGLISLCVFLTSIATMAVIMIAPIAVLTWLHRASKNAHAIAGAPLEHSPGMAVGWWFVPFANLWQPLAVVREIETASDPDGSPVASADTSWWWGTYLLGNLLGVFANDVVQPSPPEVVMGALVTIAHAIAAFMLIRIISRIHAGQRRSAKRRRWADVFADDDQGVGDDARGASETSSVVDEPAASSTSSSWTS